MSRRQRLTLLVAAICGSAVATIDGSIVTGALPAIERNLGYGLAGQQWVANAYLLSTRLADPARRLTRRRLRRAARVHNRDRRLRHLLARARARALDQPVRSGPRAAGGSGSAGTTELARDHRGRISAIGIGNPRRGVEAAACAGGQLVGAPHGALPQQA
jgi:hypothetical protein